MEDDPENQSQDVATPHAEDSVTSSGVTVGYKKPPKSRQFKKGQSGNPRGRPRGARNLRTELLDEVGEKVAIREQGVQKSVTKLRASIKSLVAKAATGEPRSAKMVLDLLLKLEESEHPPAPPSTQELDRADKEILDLYYERRLQEERDGSP